MALNPLGLAPLAVVAAVCGVVAYAAVDEDAGRRFDAVSRVLFDRYVSESPERARRLEAAFVPATYGAFAARTLAYTALAAVLGGVVGVYLFGGFLLTVPTIVDLMKGLPPTIVGALGLWTFELTLTPPQVLVVVTVGGLLVGGTAAALTYLIRWEGPRNRAAERRRDLEEGLPRTVAFMYALSRGGVAFPDVLRTLAKHEEIYGESAREASVAVREMDLFGRDMITAVRRMAERTPSEEFKTFAENLASVLQSGRSLSTFLEAQYERYQEEATARQEDVLERLATVAEVYVTVLVAGVLFLITILLVFGLTLTDTLWLLELFGYVMVPLANVGFVVYLGQKLSVLGIDGNATTTALDRYDVGSPPRPNPRTDSTRADGGLPARHEGLRQLALYDRIGQVRRLLRGPLETLVWHPTKLLYATVPLAIVYVLLRAPGAVNAGTLNVRFLDDLLVQAALFVLVTFAVVREVYNRRIRRIEASTPELLERLASLNEAGMTLVETLERVRGTDVGALTDEVERLWNDVNTGSNLEDAWIRLGRRIRTTAIIRVVTLLTNAMRASGTLGPILRVAARQARADLRLKRRRREHMISYLVVIYVSFVVFLVIIVAVHEVLVPALPTDVPTPDNTDRLAIDVESLARFGSVDKAAYTLLFFHIALIHAVFSGVVGGMLGEGTIRDGAKHAGAMLGVAYLVFLVLSSPVASVTIQEPSPGTQQIPVESVSLSDGGFVAVYEGDRNGTLLGTSGYLPPGSHANAWITLDEPVRDGDRIVVVAHMDTNDDRRLTPAGELDRPYAAPGRGDIVATELQVEAPQYRR